MKKHFLGLGPVGLVLVACTSSDPAADADANVVNIDMGGTAGNAFVPANVTIKVGQRVRWTWRGGEHNVVSGPDCATDDGKFGSGPPAAGGSYDYVFEVAGTFPYYCSVHCDMGMKGIVTVQ